MNKYRVIYYLCIIAFVANVSMMIGTMLGWFHILDSNYFFWSSLIFSLVFERIEKKVKEREKV
ncbi:hypothetical protein DF218_09545 [Streptococcus parasanguinis]|uniref:hypothetical protein n=1 Tax=Streptococcus parasanguinis TaxID=1318 RepID=UPI0010138495|nr:hypothetical protein [Streptococcus parasanguinis]RXX16706.1 hypothetical protein DF218_09545 [Streptococcus parasanguinis]